MAKLPILSGREIIKILSDNGFQITGRKGSHVKMKKTGREIFIVIIPHRKEIPIGTLKSIIRQSGLSEETFRK